MSRRSVIAGVISMATLLPVAAGCGKAPEAEPSASAAPAAKDSTAVPSPTAVAAVARPAALDAVKASGDTGTIAGWVAYQGEPPKPRPINFGGEKVCADLNSGKTPMNESLVVNPNGTLKWALVSIRDKVPGEFPVPSEPAVIDQVGCIFEPHVVALMAGQEIEYRNSDPVSHNIRGTPRKNNAFNTIFASKMTSKAKLDSAELGIPLKCDIHFWMSGYLHVMPHPFYSLTGDEGTFVIPSVPPGEYSLQIWHESLKAPVQKITVKPGEVTEIHFAMPAT